MKETGWCLGRGLVPTATDAGLGVKVDVLLNARPVIILHERTAGLVHSKVIPQFVVVQLQKLFTGSAVVRRYTESVLKEDDTVVDLEKRVSSRVLDDWSEQSIVRVAFTNCVEDVGVKFDERNG